MQFMFNSCMQDVVALATMYVDMVSDTVDTERMFKKNLKSKPRNMMSLMIACRN